MRKNYFAWFLLFASFAVLAFRLVNLHVFPEHKILTKIGNQGMFMLQTFPERGNIVDSKGESLAVSLPVTSFYIDPQKWDPSKAPLLKGYISQNKLKSISKLRKGRFFWIARQVDDRKARKILDMELEGINTVEEKKRVYPNGSLLSHVLGFCDIDGRGLSGLELNWDDILYVPYRKISKLRQVKHLSDKDFSGGTVRLSIDRRIQYIVEKHLSEKATKEKAKWAAALCIESNSGRIIAMSSWPSFNANNRKSLSNKKVLKNNCISQIYEPGSTLKPVIVAIALQAGLVAKNSYFKDNGKIKVADGWISNSHGVGRGNINLSDILTYSSNVGMAQIGMKFNPHETFKDLSSWGLGSKTDVELTGEEAGLLLPPERWYGVIPSNIAIGQGIALTPLQLLIAFNAIANGGKLLRPHIIDDVTDLNGNIIYRSRVNIVREVLSSSYVDWLRKTLRNVVVNGTGKKAATSFVKIAGKTGTAQIASKGKYLKKKMIGSFIGFWPYDKPRYTMLVVIGEPNAGHYYGGVVAAPVFRSIVEDIERLKLRE